MAYQGGYATGYQGSRDVLVIPESTFQPSAFGYGARIDDYWVRLAPSQDLPMRYFTQDSLAPRSDDRSSTEENVLDLGHQFSRSDLSGGAGLDFFPRPLAYEREAEDAIRFWDSMNVDVARPPSGVEQGWRLHRKLQEWNTGLSGNASHLLRTSDLFYVGSGNYVYWFDTLTNTVAEGSHNFTTTVDALCRVGDDVYALSNNAILKKTAAGSSFSTWHTPGAGETIQNIWGVKGRVVAHQTTTTPANALIEFDSAGSIVAGAGETYEVGTDINDVIDGGSVVLVALESGLVSSLGLDSSFNLEPISSSPMPVGEQAISMTTNQGVLVIMTIDPAADSDPIVRLYAGAVLDSRFNFVLGDLQLIREWSAPITGPRVEVSPLLSVRDDVWWAAYEPDVSGDKYVSLWRFDLRTRGYNRAHAISVSSATDPDGLTIFEDRFVFLNDNDVWAEASSTYADTGWLIGPMVNFGLNTAINWVATVLDVLDIEAAGLQVELLRSTNESALGDWEHPSWISEQRITSPFQAGVEVPILNIQAKQMALQVRLYPNAGGTPAARKMALRGLPAHRDLIVELPVNVSDVMEVPHRAPIYSSRWGDLVHERLFNFQGQHVEVLVVDPPMTVVGIVDQIAEPIPYLSSRGSQGQMCMVRIRGQRVPISSPTVPSEPGTPGTPPSYGTAGMGVGILGIATTGIGESTEIT